LSSQSVAERQVLREDRLDAGHVLVDLFVGQQLARFVLAGGIADLGRPAAHQHDRLVPGLLQPAQQHDLHETAHMQAVGRAIEADIGRDRPGQAFGVERRGVGHLVDEAALLERAEEIRF